MGKLKRRPYLAEAKSVVRLALKRIVRRPFALLPLAVGVVASATLITAALVLNQLALAGSLSEFIHDMSAKDRTLVLHESGSLGRDDYRAFRSTVEHRTADGSLLDVEQVSVASRFFDVATHNGEPVPVDRGAVLEFTRHTGFESHAVLTKGVWAGPSTSEAAISSHLAELLAIQPGDQLCVVPDVGAKPICVHVVGIWQPTSVSDPYWITETAAPNEAEVPDEFIFDTIVAAAPHVDFSAVLAPDEEQLRSADPESNLRSLSTLGTNLTRNQPGWRVDSSLPQSVATFGVASRAVSNALAILLGQVWVLAGAILAFLLWLAISSDVRTAEQLRLRGWSRSRVSLLYVIEFVVPGVAEALAGMSLGAVVARQVAGSVYSSSQLPGFVSIAQPLEVAAQLIAATLGLVALAIYAFISSLDRGKAASRVFGVRSAVFGRAATTILAILGIAALAQTYATEGVGEPSSTLSSAHVALPGIAVVLLALASAPILPAIGRAIVERTRRMHLRLGAAALVREPVGHQTLFVVASGSVAFVVIASAYSGSASDGAHVAADFEAGAPIRVAVQSDRRPDLAQVKIPAATDTSSVFRGDGRLGAGETLGVLGIDPATFAAVVNQDAFSGPAQLTNGLKRLAAADVGGVALLPGASSLSIPVRGADTGGHLTAQFTDSSGITYDVDFGALDFSGWRVLRMNVNPGLKLRLRHLSFTPVTRPGTVAFGRLTVVSASQAAVIPIFSTVTLTAPVRTGWWISDGVTGRFLQRVIADTAYPLDGQVTGHVYLASSYLPVDVHPPSEGSTGGLSLTQSPVPVLMSRSAMNAAGLHIGDHPSMAVDNQPVNTVIVGSYDSFPTLYGLSAVFALLPLTEELAEDGHSSPWPNEVWANVPPDSQMPAWSAVRMEPAVTSAVSVAELARQQQLSPGVTAARASLMLALVCVLACGLAGFTVFFVNAAVARRSLWAILEATGLDRRQLTASLFLEQTVVLAASGAVGSALGAAAAMLLIPALRLGAINVALGPPSRVSFDITVVVLGAAVSAIGWCLAAGAGWRVINSLQLVSELRGLE